MANRYWVGGTGTWNTTSTTNWSASSNGPSGASVPTSADSVFFDQAGTYTVTMTGALNCLDITVSAGTVTFTVGTTPALSVAGSWSTIAGTVWGASIPVTFTATTSKTITSGGITIGSSFTFNGSAGTWTLQDNLTFGSTITTTLTLGTLALGSFTLTTGLFSSSGTGVRTLNFGTGKIVVNSATTSTVWTTATVTNLTVSGTPLVECQGGGAGVTKTINTGALSEANAISFSLLETTGTATYAFTASNVVKNLITNGVQTVSNIAITIYGSFTHTTTNGTTTFTAGTNAWTFGATTGSYTITNIAGFTYDFPWTFGSATSTATWTPAANLTIGTTRTTTLTGGTLSLSSFTLTTGLFASNNSNTRTLDFGTGKIVLTRAATATVWTTATVTNLTVSGTPLVECQGGGAGVTKTINTGALSESNAISFSLLETAGTATYTFTAGNVVKNLICNGVQTVSNIAITIYGSFTHSTTNGATTFSAGTNAWTFGATSGSYTITPVAATTYNFPFTFGSAASTATWTLAANLTSGSGRTTTLTTGTLSLSSFTLTTGLFDSNNSNTRTLDFGTGKIALNYGSVSVSATIWDTTTITGLTVSGTPLVESSGGGGTTLAITKTISVGALSEANAISFSLLETTGTAAAKTYAFTAGDSVKNLIVNGLQTVSNIAITIYGAFTHSTTNGSAVFTAGTNAYTFGATSGSYAITPVAGFTYDFPWTFGSATSTATWTLQANLTLGATRQITLTNGTTDFNNKTLSAAGITILTGTPTISNTGSTALAFTHTSGTLTLGSNVTTTSTSGYTLTAGTLSLGSFTLTTPIFASNNSNTRTINFGTGKIVLTRAATATIWTTATVTGLTISGTPLVECQGGGTAVTKTINTGALSEANAISFSLLETTGTATYTFTAGNVVKNLICNGVQTVSNIAITIYGAFTHSTGNGTTTFTAGANAWTFAATSGNYTITNLAATTYDFPWIFGSAASTAVWTIAANLTLGATRQLTLTNGTTDFNSKTISAAGITILTGTPTIANTGTASFTTTLPITHTSGTLTLPFNITTSSASGYTFTAGSIALANYILATTVFVSSGSSTRDIDFSTTGQITLTGNAGTILSMATATGFTYSGTPRIYSTYSGATGTRTFAFGSTAGATTTNIFDVSIGTSGTGIVITSGTDSIALTGHFNTFDLSSLNQTLTNTTRTVYGDFTVPASAGTLTAGTSVTTFGGTSQNITTNGRTLDFPITVNNTSLTLQGNLTLGSTRTFTHTAGTTTMGGFLLSTGAYSSSGSTARTLAYGVGGELRLTGSGITIFDTTTATNYSTTGTVYINCTYTGATGTRTIVTGFTEAQSAGHTVATSGTTGFVLSPSATDTVALTGSFSSVDLTGFTGTLSNTARTLYGNLTTPSSGGTYTAGTSATSFRATSGTQTITTNGRTLDFPFTFNGIGGTFQLQDNLTSGSTRTTTLTNGTLDINSKVLSTGLFASSGSTARTLAFGSTGQLALTGNGVTIFNVTTATNFSTTGTPYINCTYTGATGTRTIVTGFTEAQSTGYTVATSGTTGFVLSPTATDIVALTGSFSSVDLTGFTGTLSNTARTLYGGLTIPASGGTYTAGTSATTFAGTSGTKSITSNGVTLDFPFTFNGAGSTFQLQDNLTSGSTRTTTLTAGTLNINNNILTTGLFSSSGTGVRTLAFGSTGQLVLAGNGVTIFDTTTATNYTTTGTVYINCTYAGATGTRTIVTGFTEAQSAGYTVATSGTTGFVLSPAATDIVDLTGSFSSVDLTGFTGTLSNTARTLYGGLTIPASGGTYTAGTNTTTFAGTSGTKSINGNNILLDFPFTFNGAGSTFQLTGTLNVGSTRTTTLTAGTLNLNNNILSTGLFASSGSTARTLAFSTSGQLALTSNGVTIFDVTTATSYSTTGTVYINCTYAGATGTRTIVTGFSEAQSTGYTVATSGTTGFVLSPSATDTIALTGSFNTVNLTGFTGTLSNTARTIYGGLTIGTGGTYTAGTNTTTFAGTSGTKTITSNGVTLDFPFTFNGAGSTFQLQDDLTSGSSRLTTLTAGTLSLQSFTVTTGTFNSSGTGVRTLNFGTGKIVLNGNAATTIWDTSTITSLTVSGTPLVESIGGGTAVTKTINTGALSEANAISFSLLETTGSVTYAFTASNVVDNLTINGLQTLSNIAITIYGSFTHQTTNGTTTFTAGANAWTFAATSGSYTITPVAATTYDFPWTFGSAASTATWTLAANLTLGSTRTTTLTTGTLSLSTFTLTTGLFAGSGTGVRTLNFGTGKIILNSATTSTVWTTATVTNLTVSGTPLVECQGGGTAVTKTINTGTLSEANAISFSLLETTGTATYTFTASNAVKNLICNGVQTVSNIAITIYGSFTHSTVNGTTTFTAGANAWTFGATSGSYNITNIAAFTYDWPWTFGSAASTATWTIQNNLIIGATRTLTFTNGILDFNNKTLTGTNGITIITGTTFTLNNTGGTTFTTTVPITHTSGSITLGTNLTTSSTSGYTFTSGTNTGTLDLNNYTLTTPIFTTAATAGAKTLAFGTGKIVLNGSATTTIWNTTSAAAVITTTGTPLVECIGGGTGVTKTINIGALTEANTISFSLLETTGTVTYTFTASDRVKNLIVNGSQTVSNVSISIYGNFTHLTTNGTPTFTAGANAWTFAATSGSYTLAYLSGFTYNFPWTFGSSTSTATWTLPYDLTIGSTRTTSLNTGTLALNGYTLTTGAFGHGGSVATLDFGTGKIVLNRSATATVWSSTSNLATSGTPLVECIGGGTSVTKTIITDSTEANAISFSFLETSGSVTYDVSNAYVKNVILNGQQTISDLSSGAYFRIFGSFTHLTASGTTTVSITLYFVATSGSYTITPSAVTYARAWIFGRVPGDPPTASTATWTLAGNLTVSNTLLPSTADGGVIHNMGTLSLSSYTVTARIFQCSTSFTRTLDFGTGKIIVGRSSTGTAFEMSNTTGLTITGTPIVECGGVTGTALTVDNYIYGTASISFVILNNNDSKWYIDGNVKNFTINADTGLGYTPNIAATNGNLFIYGSFTDLGGGTIRRGTSTGAISAILFYASSGSHTITPDTSPYYQSFYFGQSGTTATWTLAGNLSTTSPAISSSILNTVYLRGGTLALSSYTLTVGWDFNSNYSNTRTLDFGTGKIVMNFSDTTLSGRTIWNTSTVTGLTVTGTALVECQGGSAGTKAFDTGGTNQSDSFFNFSLLETTGTAANKTYDFTGSVKNLIINGVQTVNAVTVFGNFEYNNTNGTTTFGGTVTLAATSGTKTITSNGKTVNGNITMNGVGGTFQLQDDLTLGATNNLTLTDGTFDFNSKTFSGNSIIILTGTPTVTNTGAASLSLTVPITHTSGTFTLPFNVTTTQSYTFSSGNLNLGTNTLSVSRFLSSGTTTRTLNYGTGQLALTGNNATILSMATATGLTSQGTVYINATYTGATGTRTFDTSGLTETQAQGYNFSTSGTSGIVINPAATDTISLSGSFDDVDLTGFSQTLANDARTIYGNLTVPASGGTYTAGTSATSFRATSGTQTITTNGRTLDFPVTSNGIGGTVQLQDNLTLGATRQLTLTNGTFDFNSKAFSGGGVTILTGTPTIANTGTGSLSLTVPITHTSGSLTLPFNVTTTGAYTFTAGTLALSSYTLSAVSFASTGTGTRTLAYGTGQLALTGNNRTILNLATTTGFSSTGNVYVNCTYTGATGTRVIDLSTMTEAQVTDYSVSTSGTAGIVLSPSATDSVSLTGSFNNINLTGFTGTLTNTTRTIYGNLTFPTSGGTYTAGANITTFGATSGTKTITTNSRTIDFPLTFNGVGGTWQLQGALTMGSTRGLTHTNGTIDLNGNTLTVGTTYATAAGTKNLTFNGGTLICPAATATAFNNAQPTNYTTTAGTGTGKISMTAASAKTFVGGGSVYDCTLSNDGAGALTITGNNTFTTLANGVQPTTFTFTAGTTTTVTNWNISGTSGNLVTIGSDTTASHTLSKSSGTVTANYLSISYSSATGGATWYAGSNSTNGGNNTGWIFSGVTPPGATNSNFFQFF